MDQSEPRRVGDHEGDDYRELRRPITGDEMRIGWGKYAITVRGGITIIVVMGLAVLGLQGFMIREHDRFESAIGQQHDRTRHEFNETLRLTACIASLTAAEKAEWRASRDARNALIAFCPGLLMGLVVP